MGGLPEGMPRPRSFLIDQQPARRIDAKVDGGRGARGRADGGAAGGTGSTAAASGGAAAAEEETVPGGFTVDTQKVENLGNTGTTVNEPD